MRFFPLLCILLLLACKTITPNNSKSSLTKGEEEFQTYLDQKVAKLRGKQAPNLSYTLLDGSTQQLSDLKGKVVLLNFWFVGCKPCEVEVASLNQLLADYGSKGFVIISLGLDDIEKAKAFAERKQCKYLIAANAKEQAAKYEVSSYPSNYLIDKNGVIQEVFIGASDFDATLTYREVKPHLERMLAK